MAGQQGIHLGVVHADLLFLLEPQSATGIEAALGLADQELHIVLIDDGRRALADTPAAEALACIRCGACLNVCPVFRRVGGHAYSWVYPGPIGAVLGPGLAAAPQRELVKASSLCGACNDVCPVGIDLSGHIHEWRGVLRRQGHLARGVPRGVGWLMRHPRLWRRSLGLLKRGGRLGGFALEASHWVRAFAADGQRRLPEVPKQNFRAWWRDHTPQTNVRFTPAPLVARPKSHAAPKHRPSALLHSQKASPNPPIRLRLRGCTRTALRHLGIHSHLSTDC